MQVHKKNAGSSLLWLTVAVILSCIMQVTSFQAAVGGDDYGAVNRMSRMMIHHHYPNYDGYVKDNGKRRITIQQQQKRRRQRRTQKQREQQERREFIISSSSSLLLTATGSVLRPESCTALSPEEAALQYDTYASNYDALDGGEASSALGIKDARKALLEKLRGDVLEIGVGTGLNWFENNRSNGRNAITSLTCIDISDEMLKQAQRKWEDTKFFFLQDNSSSSTVQDSIPQVQFIKADATSQLVDIFGSQRFDTVFDTFSLCVMGNEGAKSCLHQMSQVVKKESEGGQVLLLENTRSSNPFFGMYQDMTADTAAKIGGKGCIYNQDVAQMINDSKQMKIIDSNSYAMGIFQSFDCVVAD